jgi:hypothetical protein
MHAVFKPGGSGKAGDDAQRLLGLADTGVIGRHIRVLLIHIKLLLFVLIRAEGLLQSLRG